MLYFKAKEEIIVKNQKKSVPTIDLIQAELMRSGFSAPILVSHVALTVESSLVNSSTFQGYAAISQNQLVLFRDTFPFSNYAHFATLDLNDTVLLKSGVKLILRQPYVKLKSGKYSIEISCLTQEMVDSICKHCS